MSARGRGPLVGQTLARPVAGARAASGTRRVMEFGAGTGKRAAGLLAARDAPGVELDEYLIADRAGEPRERQRDTIEAAVPALDGKGRWPAGPPERVDGVGGGNRMADAKQGRVVGQGEGATVRVGG
ncbi:class I SAM-dependent methyltransferase, partial [Burkholderia cenocepacia]